MSLRVLLRPIARLELDEAIGWYEKQKQGLGLELKEAVDQMLVRIAETPGRFRPVRGEVRRGLLRRFPYAIHFLTEPDAIVVLAIFHTRRDPRHLEGRNQGRKSNEMLPDILLKDYADKFYGFGNWNAKIWFIGIEEAGGKKFEDVARRLAAWEARGRHPLEDAPVFYPLCGNNCWHGNAAVSQDTWRKLILMLLIARGEVAEERSILEYQKNLWGAAAGNTCLVELLPLPSPSTTDWNYGLWSNLTWLAARESYARAVSAGRENELRRQIGKNKRKVVVFYGLALPGDISLLPSWSSIAGGRFVQAFEDRETLLTRTNGNTTYYVTRHPRAESDEYFKEIGLFLKRKHGGQI